MNTFIHDPMGHAPHSILKFPSHCNNIRAGKTMPVYDAGLWVDNIEFGSSTFGVHLGSHLLHNCYTPGRKTLEDIHSTELA